jgi:hypothetical protein
VEAGKIAIREGADRKMTGWERPAMTAKGFTIAYQVATPASELRTTEQTFSGLNVHWVEDPGPGKVIQFVVVLAPPPLRTMTLSEPGPNNERLLDHFRLPNGELVGVISRTTILSDNAIARIRAAVGRWTVRDPGGGPVDPSARVRCTLYVEGLDGGEGLIDVAIPCTV